MTVVLQYIESFVSILFYVVRYLGGALVWKSEIG